MIYESPYRGYGRGYGGGTWTTDYPEADNNFIVGLRECVGTNLKIAPRPEALEIMDDRIYDYPLLYIVEPGFMELSNEQAAKLHEYINRGGFIFLDDFWGDYEWENVRGTTQKSSAGLRDEGTVVDSSDLSFISRCRRDCSGAECL